VGGQDTYIEWRHDGGNFYLGAVMADACGEMGFDFHEAPEPNSLLLLGISAVACAGFGFRRLRR
jgi:hypothetical protein